jgi:hypothetical protein
MEESALVRLTVLARDQPGELNRGKPIDAAKRDSRDRIAIESR